MFAPSCQHRCATRRKVTAQRTSKAVHAAVALFDTVVVVIVAIIVDVIVDHSVVIVVVIAIIVVVVVVAGRLLFDSVVLRDASEHCDDVAHEQHERALSVATCIARALLKHNFFTKKQKKQKTKQKNKNKNKNKQTNKTNNIRSRTSEWRCRS